MSSVMRYYYPRSILYCVFVYKTLILCTEQVQDKPEIHDVVFMVASVEVHVVRVQQEVCKEQKDHLHGLFPPIHKVPVKHIRGVCRGKAILKKGKQHPLSQHELYIL